MLRVRSMWWMMNVLKVKDGEMVRWWDGEVSTLEAIILMNDLSLPSSYPTPNVCSSIHTSCVLACGVCISAFMRPASMRRRLRVVRSTAGCWWSHVRVWHLISPLNSHPSPLSLPPPPPPLPSPHLSPLTSHLSPPTSHLPHPPDKSEGEHKVY